MEKERGTVEKDGCFWWKCSTGRARGVESQCGEDGVKSRYVCAASLRLAVKR